VLRPALLACALLILTLPATAAQGQADPETLRLEGAGWAALAASRAREAAEAFGDALARNPRNARSHLGAGLAAYLERRDTDAEQAAARALQIDPALADARLLLGQAQYRLGNLAGAIRTYELLDVDAPGTRAGADSRLREHAAAALERWRREQELQGQLQQRVGTHFTISFQGPADSTLADKVLELVEAAYLRIGGTLLMYPIQPIPIVLYTADQFSDITRSPSWSAGAYDGIIRIPVRGALDNEAELQRVVAHEFTHALVGSLAPSGVPTWLNEGLATALEHPDPGALAWAEAAARRVSVPLAALEGPFGGLDAGAATAAYAVSALAVRRLIDEAGGFAITNLLQDLGEGADFETAFDRRMPLSYREFQSSLGAR